MDQRARYKYTDNGQKVKQDGILVANELYTPAERARIANSDKFFDRVEIKKTDVYFFFGARFSTV